MSLPYWLPEEKRPGFYRAIQAATRRHRARYWAISLGALQALDLLSTAMVIHAGGAERNGWVLWLGWPLTTILKAIIVYGMYLGACRSKRGFRFLQAGCAIYTVIVLLNLNHWAHLTWG